MSDNKNGREPAPGQNTRVQEGQRGQCGQKGHSGQMITITGKDTPPPPPPPSKSS